MNPGLYRAAALWALLWAIAAALFAVGHHLTKTTPEREPQ